MLKEKLGISVKMEQGTPRIHLITKAANKLAKLSESAISELWKQLKVDINQVNT